MKGQYVKLVEDYQLPEPSSVKELHEKMLHGASIASVQTYPGTLGISVVYEPIFKTDNRYWHFNSTKRGGSVTLVVSEIENVFKTLNDNNKPLYKINKDDAGRCQMEIHFEE
jgi:hypothetical protein